MVKNTTAVVGHGLVVAFVSHGQQETLGRAIHTNNRPIVITFGCLQLFYVVYSCSLSGTKVCHAITHSLGFSSGFRSYWVCV